MNLPLLAQMRNTPGLRVDISAMGNQKADDIRVSGRGRLEKIGMSSDSY